MFFTKMMLKLVSGSMERSLVRMRLFSVMNTKTVHWNSGVKSVSPHSVLWVYWSRVLVQTVGHMCIY